MIQIMSDHAPQISRASRIVKNRPHQCQSIHKRDLNEDLVIQVPSEVMNRNSMWGVSKAQMPTNQGESHGR